MTIRSDVSKALAATTLLAAMAGPVAAQVVDFNFKLNQGDVGTTFATLTLSPENGGTLFTLNTALTGGQGNPGIAELLFGCNGCSSSFASSTPGVTIGAGSTQSSYDWNFAVALDPAVDGTNTPLTWTGSSAPSTYLELTPGSGPNALAMIQLTGGSQSVNGVSIGSGFYVATAPVPEPSTYALLVAGLGLVGFAAKRRKKIHD